MLVQTRKKNVDCHKVPALYPPESEVRDVVKRNMDPVLLHVINGRRNLDAHMDAGVDVEVRMVIDIPREARAAKGERGGEAADTVDIEGGLKGRGGLNSLAVVGIHAQARRSGVVGATALKGKLAIEAGRVRVQANAASVKYRRYAYIALGGSGGPAGGR